MAMLVTTVMIASLGWMKLLTCSAESSSVFIANVRLARHRKSAWPIIIERRRRTSFYDR
jgi:hypothetical protein